MLRGIEASYFDFSMQPAGLADFRCDLSAREEFGDTDQLVFCLFTILVGCVLLNFKLAQAVVVVLDTPYQLVVSFMLDIVLYFMGLNMVFWV
jgi:hypothetical protein